MKTKIPTGQKLADAMAKMMGKKPHPRFNPQTDYNDCRIVEDWIWENGLWDKWAGIMAFNDDDFQKANVSGDRNAIGTQGAIVVSRATALQRCRAAWLAWKEGKK